MVASKGAQPPRAPVAFPGKTSERGSAISNIPINVPRHFLGREAALTATDAELRSNSGRVAITALHGLRGVGKSTLAVAYAHRCREDYRATWWIRAETEPTMRADLASLGVRLGLVAAEAAEEVAIDATLTKLVDNGGDILLIYDNANNSREIQRYLPRGGAARIIVTERDAPHDYGRTVATTFALAIEAAAKLQPAAEALIVHAALLAAEPIPLFLFSEATEEYGEPMASTLSGYGLDEAVGALLAFALVDRESIPDERDPTIVTDCIRLHRLVRQVAAARCTGGTRKDAIRKLIVALARVLPGGIYNDPQAWLRMRRLDPLALALVGGCASFPEGAERSAAVLLNGLAAYRQVALAAYSSALPLFECALAIREKALNSDHPDTATSLNNLGFLLLMQGDLEDARPYYERALAINEKVLGPDHPDTARSLNNLGLLLQEQGDLAGARPHYERALAIREKVLISDHPDTARSLNNLGYLVDSQGDLDGARPYYERALAINEKALGPDHPDTALSLNNFGHLLVAQGDLEGARPYHERALAIREKVLGPDHPDTAGSLNNIGYLLQEQGDLEGARRYYESALDICEKSLGPAHPSTQTVAANTAFLLDRLTLRKQAVALRKKFGLK